MQELPELTSSLQNGPTAEHPKAGLPHNALATSSTDQVFFEVILIKVPNSVDPGHTIFPRKDADYILGSPDRQGKQPYWPDAAMEDHIRPAAKRAGIEKRLGWHTFRHTFGTLVKSQGADVATTQALLRHANVSITMDRYVRAVTPAKREALSRIVKMLPFPNVPTRLTETAATA